MARKKKLYLVQRLSWCTAGGDELQRGIAENTHEYREGVPVRAFLNKAEASIHADRLAAEARRELNPFQFMYQDVEAIVEGGEESLLASLAKLDLPMPTPKFTSSGREYTDWPRWYDELADTLTDAERDAIWKLLDRLELYRVVDVEFF